MSVAYAEVIGDPIAQSKSPAIHGFWLEKLGLHRDYRATLVTPADLPAFIAGRRADADWCGCNVTMPHKQAVMPLLDALDPLAQRVGAVNTVVRGAGGRLTGYNTDVAGFIEPLLPFVDRQTYRFASLIGAGGAARAVAAALDAQGFTIISYSRDPEKTDRAIGRYIWDKHLLMPLDGLAGPDPWIEFEAKPDRIDVFINASPLGMVGNPPLLVNLDGMNPEVVVYDIVTAPLETPLLAAARARGLRTIDGLAMLIGQAAQAFELFFGVAPPREDGDAALRAVLTA